MRRMGLPVSRRLTIAAISGSSISVGGPKRSPAGAVCFDLMPDGAIVTEPSLSDTQFRVPYFPSSSTRPGSVEASAS